MNKIFAIIFVYCVSLSPLNAMENSSYESKAKQYFSEYDFTQIQNVEAVLAQSAEAALVKNAETAPVQNIEVAGIIDSISDFISRHCSNCSGWL